MVSGPKSLGIMVVCTQFPILFWESLSHEERQYHLKSDKLFPVTPVFYRCKFIFGGGWAGVQKEGNNNFIIITL